jgi:hypothetical protein
MWSTFDFDGWTGPDWKWPPHTFYALWKYAQVFGGAKSIFDSCQGRLWTPPSDAILAEYPFAHNAWMPDIGYLNRRNRPVILKTDQRDVEPLAEFEHPLYHDNPRDLTRNAARF